MAVASAEAASAASEVSKNSNKEDFTVLIKDKQRTFVGLGGLHGALRIAIFIILFAYKRSHIFCKCIRPTHTLTQIHLFICLH